MKSTVFAVVGTLSVHSAAFFGMSPHGDSMGPSTAQASQQVEFEVMAPPPVPAELASKAPEPTAPTPPPRAVRPRMPRPARVARSAGQAPKIAPDPTPELAVPSEQPDPEPMEPTTVADAALEPVSDALPEAALPDEPLRPSDVALPSLSANAKTATGSGRSGGGGAGSGSKPGTPRGSAASGQSAGTGSGKARPAQLNMSSWRCSWPADAEYEPIDKQDVVLRVVVAEDGRVERAEVLSDPGHGFGTATRACAQRTRFQPALDERGNAIRAQSPPIVVHFTR